MDAKAEIISFSRAQSGTADGDVTPARQPGPKRRRGRPPISFNYMADMESRLAAPNSLLEGLAGLLDDLAFNSTRDEPYFHHLAVLAATAKQCARLVSDCSEYAGMCALAAAKGDDE